MQCTFRILSVLCLFTVVLGQKNFGYNCLRPGGDCIGGTCDKNSPKACTCDPGREGYDCKVDTATEACATLSCGPGKCQDETCVCQAGYYYHIGEKTCKDRASIFSCSDESIVMQVVPFEGFVGSIYIKGFDDEPTCLFQPQPIADINGPVYRLEQIYASTTCGPANIDPLGANNGFTAIIQYGDVVTGLEQSVTFSCKILQEGGEAILDSSAVAIVALDPLNDVEPISVDSDSESGLTVSVTLRGGTPITGSQNVGKPLQILVDNDLSKFQGMKLLKLVGKDSTGGKEMVLVEDGCVRKDALYVVDALTTEEDRDGLSITAFFKLFMFPGDPSLTFQVNVALCEAKDGAACQPTDCSANPLGIGPVDEITDGIGRRRKRQAEEEDEPSVEKTMVVSLFVENPAFLSRANQKPVEVKAAGCLQNLVFLVPLVVLLVLLLGAMFMALFFCLKVTRNNSINDSHGQMMHKS